MMNSCVRYLDEISERFPDKTAIIDDKRKVTFRELKENSRKLASQIHPRYRNQPVAVFLPKSISAIECFMGVLYSGNFYVPVDVDSPMERIRKIIENLEPVIIFTSQKYSDVLCEHFKESSIEIINMDQPGVHVPGVYENRLEAVIDTDPIYCIYTSGSTGAPKGVVVSHRAVNDFIEWSVEVYGIDQETIIGNQVPLLFDVSVMDIYLCLKTGATLHFIPKLLFAFPIRVLEYLKEHRINYIIWVPSVLINIANSGVLDQVELPDLKKILFAGEVMPNKYLNIWRRIIPDALYSNLYGPTEASVIATYYIVDREFKDDESLPIGFPCRNIDALILNEHNERAAIGEIGELLIRGTALAMGYWNDPEKTRGSFVLNPLNDKYPELVYKTGDLVRLNENMEIIYLGRKDFQIKHMGYRIELGDVENAVLNITEITNSCVLYDFDNKHIVLFFVSSSDSMNESYLRTALAEWLPKYMLPSKFIKITEMPLNINGKIDKVSLKSTYLG